MKKQKPSLSKVVIENIAGQITEFKRKKSFISIIKKWLIKILN
jgi:hypothetical protein